MSGNEFTAEHFELMRISMSNNKSLTNLDIRRNPGCTEAIKAIEEIEKCVHQNEHQARSSFNL